MAVTSLDATLPGFVPRASRVAVTACNGMVASAHPLASLSGLRVLVDGGNAIDAAVATAATLNAVEPNMSGALGVGQMLVRTANNDEVIALDFGGRSPAAATPQAFAGDSAIPQDDLRSALVPANLGGWLAALERFGSMDRARVFRDVIDYAENGFPLTEGNAGWIATNRARLQTFETSRRFYANNPAPSAGAIFRQPQLAESYRRFVAEGADALYGGAIGGEIARYCQEQGGLITREDLAQPQLRWTTPIGTRFREFDVLTMPPPSMGIQILISARQAVDSPGERWSRSGSLVAGVAGDPGHTTYLCAADSVGNVVSMTQSLGNAFGCGAIAGETGLFLNDFAWWFDVEAGSPNQIAPNRSVEQCLSPCMVLNSGQLLMAIGTPGGHGIPQTTSQMLLNVLDFGMSVQEAIEAPRIRVFTGTHVDIEDRVSADVRAKLEARGHALTVLPAFHWGVGGGQGLYRVAESGAFIGGADPRRDGYA